MKKIKVLLRVGYPKTGTTSLQNNLFQGLEGIQYLGKFNNKNFLYEFEQDMISELIFKKQGDIDFNYIRKKLLKKIKCNVVLISEESLLSNSLRVTKVNNEFLVPNVEDVCMNLRKLFIPDIFDVKILVTIRRQDEMLTSLYAQSYLHYYSKYSNLNTFQKFIDQFTGVKPDNIAYKKSLDYYNAISSYCTNFGYKNTFVLVYEEMKYEPAMFYSKLYDYLGLNDVKSEQNFEIKIENKRSTDMGYKMVKNYTFYDWLFSIKSKYIPNVRLGVASKFMLLFKKISLKTNDDVSQMIKLSTTDEKAIRKVYQESNMNIEKMYQLDLGRYGYFDV